VVLQHLTYLVALAQERHFGRAAEACHVSQATLSAAIRRLEEEFGAPLVHRGHRFHGLTLEGEHALTWANRILADCHGMKTDIAGLRGELTGPLHVGVVPTALPVLSLLAAPLLQRHPGLRLVIRSSSSTSVAAGLRGGQLDIGLTYLDDDPPRGLRSRRVYAERYLLLTPSDSELASQEVVSWQDAAEARLCLLSDEMQGRRIIDQAFARCGAQPRPVAEANSVSTLHALVRNANLCTIVAESWLLVFDVPDGVSAVALVEPVTTADVGLVWPDRDPESSIVRALIGAVDDIDVAVATPARPGQPPIADIDRAG
jgi:DNA-binding transcriptional LysR family regulator